MKPDQKSGLKPTVRLPLHSHYERVGSVFVDSEGWLLPRSFQNVEKEVDLLERGEALVDFSDHGMLRMIGEESVELLQRIATNDFSHFEHGNLLQTSLLTEKGRIVDSILVLHCGDELLLFTSRGAAEMVQQWIEKFIIMEDISIVQGKKDSVLLISLMPRVNVGTQYSGCIGRCSYFGHDASLYSYHSADDALKSLGSRTSKIVGRDAFNYFRIMRGIPEYGREVVLDFNPLELGLWEQVSSTKGCYIGQEVIARLETYKKIQRSLCTVRGNSLFQAEDVNRLMSGGIETGRITSISPDIREPKRSVGLALVKQEYSRQGREFISDHGEIDVTIETVHDKRGILEFQGGSQ